MFWDRVAAIAGLFTRRRVGTSESSASNATDPSEKQETSSTQREGSDTISRVSLRGWPSTEPLVTGSSFSEAMSDNVTVDQQRWEEQNAMAMNRDRSPVSEELIRTGQCIQDNRGELVSPLTAGFWPNSNQMAVYVTPVRAGCSRAPKDDDSPASTDTDAILEGMTYFGGTNYAKYRLEACPAKASGKQKMRPPALCVQNELTRENVSSYRDSTVSTTSSRRSSPYRAVDEAAAARTAMIQAEAEAQLALAHLADTRAECNEQHKVMAAELEAMQDSVKCSLRAATQQTTVQAAKVDAMGYRLEEMKDLLLQRELRMEVQMAELSNQMHTLGSASFAVAPETEQAKVVEPIASTSKMVPMYTLNPPVPWKTSPKTEPRVLKPPQTGKKTTKLHVCTPNSLSAPQLPSMMSLTRTRDQGVDLMTATSSTVDLTDTRATAGSHTSSAEDEACTTARVRTVGTSSMFLTASEGILTGNPCASSTRKKDNVNGELSMQATRGSRENSPAPSEGEEVIFT